MKTTKKLVIKTEKLRRDVWAWRVNRGAHQVAGGLCRTKADARNDSAVWCGAALDVQPRTFSAHVPASIPCALGPDGFGR